MGYKCKITEIQKGESKQYATAYTYFLKLSFSPKSIPIIFFYRT